MALATEAGRPGALPDAPVRAQRRRRGRWHLGLGSALLMGLAASPALAAPSFDEPAPAQSADGSLQLAWGEALGEFEVELRHEGTVRTVYTGRMPSAHVSGLPNGHYELRVRAREGDGWSPWSEPKVLDVEHHPMSLVWTLMALGALVFVGTAVVVLRSDRGAR